MRAHPVSGQTVAAETKPMGMFTRRPLACVRRIKKKKSIRRRVCKREEWVRDSVVFCRYREIYATCCMRIRTCVKCVYLAFFVGAFFDREIICSFLRNRRRFLCITRACVFAVHSYYCWTFECRKANDDNNYYYYYYDYHLGAPAKQTPRVRILLT